MMASNYHAYCCAKWCSSSAKNGVKHFFRVPTDNSWLNCWAPCRDPLGPPCKPWPTLSSAGRLHPYVTGPATSCCSGSLECQHQSCPMAAVLNTSKLLSKALHDIKALYVKYDEKAMCSAFTMLMLRKAFKGCGQRTTCGNCALNRRCGLPSKVDLC
ncbi:uncharacterized protein LOC119175781 isoform X2 [Rhipicephalus microplus]|uniref:uncharacterized protein LOC119175781 isoform X2 n=1 Tax=Rhipicephalus microplus TaxID=6941 RepID=UPI003F6AFAF9